MNILLLAALFVVAASTAIDFDFSAFADTATEDIDLEDTDVANPVWWNCTFRKLAYNSITIT